MFTDSVDQGLLAFWLTWTSREFLAYLMKEFDIAIHRKYSSEVLNLVEILWREFLFAAIMKLKDI